ncbi:MAG: 50S ribosomal protein L21 [Planctomycetota bacterium]
MYAVIRDGSVQLRVAKGDVVEIERVDLEAGSAYNFDVLALNKDGKTTFGSPTVSGAKVVGEVVAEVKGQKLQVGHFKRRKGYQKRIGHRQRRTKVRITEISG